MFCASQLHVNLIRDPNFKTNPELALKQAYAATDKQFLKKAEEQVIWMLEKCFWFFVNSSKM